jgi:hypothetical protein
VVSSGTSRPASCKASGPPGLIVPVTASIGK